MTCFSYKDNFSLLCWILHLLTLFYPLSHIQDWITGFQFCVPTYLKSICKCNKCLYTALSRPLIKTSERTRSRICKIHFTNSSNFNSSLLATQVSGQSCVYFRLYSILPYFTEKLIRTVYEIVSKKPQKIASRYSKLLLHPRKFLLWYKSVIFLDKSATSVSCLFALGCLQIKCSGKIISLFSPFSRFALFQYSKIIFSNSPPQLSMNTPK